MGSVECIKPNNSTTFKPPSQNWRNTGGQVGCQIVSFYHPLFSEVGPVLWFIVIVEIQPVLCCSFGDFCVWSVFRIFEHSEDEQEIHWKKQYGNITTGSFIYVIENCWSLDVHEIFVCQISIYLILCTFSWPFVDLCWPWVWLAERRYICSIMYAQLHTKV